MNAVELSEGIYRVGSNIENGDRFEGLWPIPDGVSLNCYAVIGEKKALIDLVRDWDDAPSDIQKQLSSIPLSFDELDYLILNHMEPDHTGWLIDFIKRAPKTELVVNAKGAAFLKGFFGITENVKVIGPGEILDLGNGKELLFDNIPNVHWPETMVTYEKKFRNSFFM